MTATPHPTYPNPTITEAICEIHFDLPKHRPWKASYPGRFFREIQDDYPEMEVGQQTAFQIEIGPMGASQRLVPIPPRTRYTHKNEQKLLQLTENIFTVNFLEPYPGWETVRQTLIEVWPKIIKVLRPTVIKRIGLRYINQIPLESPQQEGNIWLKPGRYIPASVLDAVFPSLSRVDVAISEHDKVIVSIARAMAETSRQNVLVLDVDRLVEREIEPQERPLMEEIELLHTDLWDIFYTARTDKLIDLLQGAVV
jgi:uncharacterized protein (TIGR04255 family)